MTGTARGPILAPEAEKMSGSTLILIPACDEQGRVGRVLRGLREAAVSADVLVIDDGSTDGTAEEARRHGAIVVRHPFNLGYGSSLLTGYHFARRRGYARIVQMDADGQHDPGSVPDLLAALDEGADVVVGSRYLGSQPPPTSWPRRVGSWLFAKIATLWTGTRITDPTSGFQAIRARALDELAHHGFPEDHPDADVLIMLKRAGMVLREIPVVMHPRSGGHSMLRGGRAAYYAYKMLLTLSLLPVRRRSPFRSERLSSARAS